jgi:hypothetical protein
MKPSNIDVWLSRGKKVELGGRELTMMPLPLSKLRGVQAVLEEKIYERTHELVEDQKRSPDAMQFIADILKSMDFVDMTYHILADPKRPDDSGPINPGLTKQFVEDYLDTPTLRKLVLTFIEVNELEEVVKGFMSLPGVTKLVEVLMTTFGTTFLASFSRNSISTAGRSQNSPIHSSQDTLQPTTVGENPPKEMGKETVQ